MSRNRPFLLATSASVGDRTKSVAGAMLFALLVAGCASDDGSTDPGIEPPQQDTGPSVQPSPIPVVPGPVLGEGTQVGSASIKSYLEDTEREPPFLTGSIFANGFSLSNTGAAGAPGVDVLAPHLLAQTLGLGSGDLTVLALFDRSVSMSDPWEGQPRWKVAGRAFMDGLKGVEEQVTLGAMFFPQAAECDVAPLSDPRQIQFQPGTTFQQHWEAFPQNRFPSGGTPLGPAFEEVDAVVSEAFDYGLIGAGRRFRVVVITDGKPNCGTDPARVLHLATTWRALGVEVAVIGLPGSEEATDFLDQLAMAGGTTQHRSASDADEAEEEFAIVVR